jgi:hypothetical protein
MHVSCRIVNPLRLLTITASLGLGLNYVMVGRLSIPFFSFCNSMTFSVKHGQIGRPTHLLDGLFGIWLSLLGLFGDLLRGNRLVLFN